MEHGLLGQIALGTGCCFLVPATRTDIAGHSIGGFQTSKHLKMSDQRFVLSGSGAYTHRFWTLSRTRTMCGGRRGFVPYMCCMHGVRCLLKLEDHRRKLVAPSFSRTGGAAPTLGR